MKLLYGKLVFTSCEAKKPKTEEQKIEECALNFSGKPFDIVAPLKIFVK